MNVLYIVSWYPSKSDRVAGIFIEEHKKAIESAGANVRVIDLYYNKHVRAIVPLMMLIAVIKYLKIRRKFKPDIVHSNIISPALFAGWIISVISGAPHLHTEQWTKVDKFFQKHLLSGLAKRILNRCYIVFCVSAFLAEKMRKYTTSYCYVIPNVVSDDIKFTNKTRSKILSLCMIAKWHYPKRPDLVIEAVKELQKMVPFKVVLHIIGNGDLMQDMELRADSSSFIFHGECNKKTINKILSACDFLFTHLTLRLFR